MESQPADITQLLFRSGSEVEAAGARAFFKIAARHGGEPAQISTPKRAVKTTESAAPRAGSRRGISPPTAPRRGISRGAAGMRMPTARVQIGRLRLRGIGGPIGLLLFFLPAMTLVHRQCGARPGAHDDQSDGGGAFHVRDSCSPLKECPRPMKRSRATGRPPSRPPKFDDSYWAARCGQENRRRSERRARSRPKWRSR